MKRDPQRPKAAKLCETTISAKGHIHPALQDYLGYCLVKTAMRMKAGLEQSFKDHDLIPPHFAILTVLNAQEPLNQLALGEQLGIDKATMVKLIDGLEDKQLVERTTCPDDRRAKFVSITEKGRKTLKKLLTLAERSQQAFLEPLTKSEVQQFKATLVKLLRMDQD